MATMSDFTGYVASTLVLLTFMSKDMHLLRVIAILSNLAFISYGKLASLPPVLGLHLVLLPLNILRLREIITTQPAHRSGDATPFSIITVTSALLRRSRALGSPIGRFAFARSN
jgi:CRP/FNR family transcriptional regulator, cyclic AMP receptor protein